MSLRFTQPSREDMVSEEDLEIWDREFARMRKLRPEREGAGPYYGALLNDPPLAALWGDIGRFFRSSAARGAIPDVWREFGDLVMFKELDTWFFLMGHLPDGLAAGMRAEAVTAVLDLDDANLTADELAIATFVRHAARRSLTDQMFEDAQRILGVRGVLEYSAFLGFLICSVVLMGAIGVPDATEQDIRELLAKLQRGEQTR